MKIVIVGPVYPWKGGIAKYLDSLAVELKQRTDNDVTLITFYKQYPSFLRKTQLNDALILSDNFLPMLSPLNPISWHLKDVEPLVRFNLAIFKYWHPYFAPCFGSLAKQLRKAGTKICFIVDNVTPHEKFPLSNFLTDHCLSKGNFFVVHSNKVREELGQLLPKTEIKQIPHPVYEYGTKQNKSFARGMLNLPLDKRIILFFGYIRPYKGLDILLHAFAALQGWYNSSTLVVAGEAFESIDKYKALAAALGIQRQIVWRNSYIPDDGIKHYFSAADLLVLPYKEATQSGIAEIGRAFDLPVIATDTGGLKEQVEIAVQPYDSTAIFGAMTRFFSGDLNCGYKQKATTFYDLAQTIIQ